ncbi:MAG: chromosome partitioning protein ParB [Bacteroidetes bacterium]|nr:MAG: chromosome partitioning protein ParB [Bacteroidota bacterium]
MKTKKSALGRGLSAILESPDTDITSRDISGSYVAGAIATILLEKIEANPFQPRNSFEQESLEELAASIKTQGIIQPVTVRKMGYDKYQLISGERRFRASKLAGLDTIPTFIRVANDQQMLEMALIENIHRENLNSLDVGISYQRLIEECKITIDELSERIGKNRTTVSNYIRLLKLPPAIQIALRDNRISMGHARAIINIDDERTQLQVLKEIFDKQLSVRQVEKRAKEINNTGEVSMISKAVLPEKYNRVKDELSVQFNTKVEIRRSNKGKGSIVIPFKSENEFEKIITILGQ